MFYAVISFSPDFGEPYGQSLREISALAVSVLELVGKNNHFVFTGSDIGSPDCRLTGGPKSTLSSRKIALITLN